MAKPRYQGLLNEKIPVVNLPLDAEEGTDSLGSVRVIAGSFGNARGSAKTFSPVNLWDVSLPNVGAEVDIPFVADHNCIVFVRRGSVAVLSGSGEELKESKLGPQDVALMRTDSSDMLKLRVLEADSSVLIMGGEPLNEPIAARGPFVMNTQEQLRQAMLDYQNGKIGR